MSGKSAEDVDEELFITKLWRWWRIAWAIIRNILYITLVFLAFEKASSAFENLVLCLLVLILQAVTWGATTQLRVTIEEAFIVRRSLFAIQKSSGEDMEGVSEAMEELERKYRKGNPIYYINMAGATLVYFILIWKLFTTLFVF